MNPHQRFEWCLQRILRPMFQLTMLDIFRADYRKNFIYSVINAVYYLTFISYFYTVFTYDLVTVIMSLTVACMIFEVCR